MTAKSSEQYGKTLLDDPRSCWERCRTLAERSPDDIALVSMHQPAGLYNIPIVEHGNIGSSSNGSYLTLTYKNLESAVDRLTDGLRTLGVRPGHGLVTFLPNGVERILTFFASSRIGSTFVPISIQNLANTEEVTHMLRVCR